VPTKAITRVKTTPIDGINQAMAVKSDPAPVAAALASIAIAIRKTVATTARRTTTFRIGEETTTLSSWDT
jgi:hypothetical protein